MAIVYDYQSNGLQYKDYETKWECLTILRPSEIVNLS